MTSPHHKKLTPYDESIQEAYKDAPLSPNSKKQPLIKMVHSRSDFMAASTPVTLVLSGKLSDPSHRIGSKLIHKDPFNTSEIPDVKNSCHSSTHSNNPKPCFISQNHEVKNPLKFTEVNFL